ncbi:MAG: ABC transporter ATP-binding protein [Planctomycetes bacterium]|nr:ABC transporter ATP-binding protein [Planctomycetota bacterium]
MSDITFRVRKGEVVGLVGSNGSGKSTLFNVITGIYAVSAGRILFQGQDLSGLSRHTIARLGIARTFQSPRLFTGLSVLENAVIGVDAPYKTPTLLNLLRQLWIPWHRYASAARGAISACRLGMHEDRNPATLPYGERRLLEVSRCLVSSPSLLLLDEPTAGLSDEESNALIRLLHGTARDTGLTLIVIDHRVSFIRALCDRLVVLNHGELLEDGLTAAVLAAPHVIAAYLGEEG